MSLGADTDLLSNWGKSLCPLAPVSCSVDGALLASIHKWEKAADKALRQVCPVLHSCLPSLDCFENDYSEGRSFSGEGVEAADNRHIQR